MGQPEYSQLAYGLYYKLLFVICSPFKQRNILSATNIAILIEINKFIPKY